MLYTLLVSENSKIIQFVTLSNLTGLQKEAGLNSFTLTPKQRVEKTAAIKENFVPDYLTPQKTSFVYPMKQIY